MKIKASDLIGMLSIVGCMLGSYWIGFDSGKDKGFKEGAEKIGNLSDDAKKYQYISGYVASYLDAKKGETDDAKKEES